MLLEAVAALARESEIVLVASNIEAPASSTTHLDSGLEDSGQEQLVLLVLLVLLHQLVLLVVQLHRLHQLRQLRQLDLQDDGHDGHDHHHNHHLLPTCVLHRHTNAPIHQCINAIGKMTTRVPLLTTPLIPQHKTTRRVS